MSRQLSQAATKQLLRDTGNKVEPRRLPQIRYSDGYPFIGPVDDNGNNAFHLAAHYPANNRKQAFEALIAIQRANMSYANQVRSYFNPALGIAKLLNKHNGAGKTVLDIVISSDNNDGSEAYLRSLGALKNDEIAAAATASVEKPDTTPTYINLYFAQVQLKHFMIAVTCMAVLGFIALSATGYCDPLFKAMNLMSNGGGGEGAGNTVLHAFSGAGERELYAQSAGLKILPR